jgi:hypothetical protein
MIQRIAPTQLERGLVNGINMIRRSIFPAFDVESEGEAAPFTWRGTKRRYCNSGSISACMSAMARAPVKLLPGM